MSVCLYFCLRYQISSIPRVCVLYIVICGLSGSTTFFRFISNGTVFRGGKKLLSVKCVFWFPLEIASKTFLILRNLQRSYNHKFTQVFTHSTAYSFQNLIKLNLSRNICENHSSKKFHENPSGWNPVVPLGYRGGQAERWTGRWTDMTNLILALRNFSNVSKR